MKRGLGEWPCIIGWLYWRTFYAALKNTDSVSPRMFRLAGHDHTLSPGLSPHIMPLKLLSNLSQTHFLRFHLILVWYFLIVLCIEIWCITYIFRTTLYKRQMVRQLRQQLLNQILNKLLKQLLNKLPNQLLYQLWKPSKAKAVSQLTRWNYLEKRFNFWLYFKKNNGSVNVTSPVIAVPTVVQTVTQPMTQPMNPIGGQLIQMPNGQLFMLPSNSYPMVQPVIVQAVQPVGVNNEAFKPVM